MVKPLIYIYIYILLSFIYSNIGHLLLLFFFGGEHWSLKLQTVFENSLVKHHVALPPGSMGKITYIAPAGQYNLKVGLLSLLVLLLH